MLTLPKWWPVYIGVREIGHILNKSSICFCLDRNWYYYNSKYRNKSFLKILFFKLMYATEKTLLDQLTFSIKLSQTLLDGAKKKLNITD